MLPIIRHRKIWFILSGVAIAAAITALAVWGVKFGTDFTGGSLLEARWTGSAPTVPELAATLDTLLERDFVIQSTETNGTIIRMENLSEEQHQAILGTLRQAHGEMDELRFDSIGPVIGQELARKSIWALIIIFVAIVLYVAISFRRISKPVSSWKYGLITIAAGFHDVIIPIGLFSVLGRFAGVEVGAAFVAAVLTILGYSINDTIVVFDRIRENLTRGAGEFETIVEQSVNQTMARSLNTTLTTLLALVTVYFFGGLTVRNFALALIVGIATGAYSSIFIASPLLVVWQRWTGRGSP